MEEPAPITPPGQRVQAAEFLSITIDHDQRLLEQSYRLRYQVYCTERHYLDPSNYPDQLEFDEFEAHSVHVGVIDSHGELAATARVIRPSSAGLPMFRYCALGPEVRTFQAAGTTAVEISRVSISRDYVRQRRRTEPFLTLMKAVVRGAKAAGATHLVGATDAALHRWLLHFGFPYRVSGPTVDYYGPVAPCVMSLQELDQVIIGGHYPWLGDIPVGCAGTPWTGCIAEPAPASLPVVAAAAVAGGFR